MAVESIERDRFEEVLQQAKGPIAIDLWMDDCPPCTMMAPKLRKVSAKYAGKVATYRVKVNEGDPLLEEYGIEAMPAILFFRDGENLQHIEGLVHSNELRAAFNDLASTS